jgi:hypothetical protein
MLHGFSLYQDELDGKTTIDNISYRLSRLRDEIKARKLKEAPTEFHQALRVVEIVQRRDVDGDYEMAFIFVNTNVD